MTLAVTGALSPSAEALAGAVGDTSPLPDLEARAVVESRSGKGIIVSPSSLVARGGRGSFLDRIGTNCYAGEELVMTSDQHDHGPASTDWSFDELLVTLKGRLERILFRYQIPPEDSEDVLQEALLTLIYKRPKIRDPEAWLLATLRNRCLMYWRSKRSRLYDAVDANILELMAKPVGTAQERFDVQADLARAISELPDRCQSLLRLRYGLGYEPAEVAERMGYQASSIRKITSRCLDALNRQLGVSGFLRGSDEP